MKVLHLVLKAKWYDMIASGEKTAEYREIKPYWIRRLIDCSHNEDGDCWPIDYVTDIPTMSVVPEHLKHFDFVRLHRGYTGTTMDFEIAQIRVGFGVPQWGAPEHKEVFVIKLGKRI